MTTKSADTIPEAREAAEAIYNPPYDSTFETPKEWIRIISEAITKHYKRHLAECSGEVRELYKQLLLIVLGNSFHKQDSVEELLQLHTAKAVEEATKKNRCETCGSKLYFGPPDCCFCGAPNCCQWCCQITTLQKQCEELRTKADQERELHTMQLVAIMTASIQNTEDTIKDRIGPGHNYATVAYSDVCQAVNREMRERTRAEKAEAEVAELKTHLGYKNDTANTFMNQVKKLQAEIAQLQQDVRPLLEELSNIAALSLSTSDEKKRLGLRANQALETFLAKHPKLK